MPARDLRRARRVDRAHVRGARIEGACTTAPDTTGSDREGTVQCNCGVVRAHRAIKTSVRRRSRRDGEGHLVVHRTAIAIAHGGERQRHRTRRAFGSARRVHRVHRGVVRVVGTRTAAPYAHRCEPVNGTSQGDGGVVRAHRCVRDLRSPLAQA